MKARYFLLGGGALMALIGAALVFALKDPADSIAGVELQPFGGVLLAAGILLMGIVAIASLEGGRGSGGDGSGDLNSIKAIGGLIAVVVGVGAVALLTIVTLTRFDATKEDSAIAVASSAFGVISALVGAYLGIKVTADTTAKAGVEAKQAAVAQHEAGLARQQVSAMEESAEAEAPEKADQIKAAGLLARDEAARRPRPQKGTRNI